MRFAEIGIVAVLALAIFASLPTFSGNFLVVLSGSMSPAINAGDLVVASPVSPADVKVGDIIVFNEKKAKITHRVVSITDSGFITKGDANEDPDAQARSKNDVFGKAVFWVPFAGYFVNFARSFYGFVLLVIVPGILLIIGEIRKIHFHIKNPERVHMKNIPKYNKKNVPERRHGERKKLKVVIVKSLLLIVFSLAFMSSGFIATSAYLSDTETSEGNSISAWAESCALTIDTSKAKLAAFPATPTKSLLFRIKLMNNCISNITIDRMNVSWNADSGEIMKKVMIGGKKFFDGNATSGTMTDGNDVTIKPSKKKWLFIWFDGDMQGKSFTIQFIMKDGCSKTVEFAPESFPNITGMEDIENNPNIPGEDFSEADEE